jgi:hypothetical protein
MMVFLSHGEEGKKKAKTRLKHLPDTMANEDDDANSPTPMAKSEIPVPLEACHIDIGRVRLEPKERTGAATMTDHVRLS